MRVARPADGALSFSDSLRPQAKAAIAALHRQGIHAILLSGDNPPAAGRVANALGIDEVHAGILPEGKAGILQSASVALMRADPALVPAALSLAGCTLAKIKQNLFWAFAYNVVGIPLAASGYLSPVVAGAAMALSSVSVLGNALLLKRWKLAP